MSIINEGGQLLRGRRGVPAIETRQLADYLLGAESELITYEELSAVIGQNVQGKARCYLLSARKIALREKGMVFRPVRNIGIKRLNQIEVAKLEDRFHHVRRTHKQTIREMKTVDIAALPVVERASCVGKLALATLTVNTHGSKQMKRLEAAVNVKHELNLLETLDVFRKK